MLDFLLLGLSVYLGIGLVLAVGFSVYGTNPNNAESLRQARRLINDSLPGFGDRFSDSELDTYIRLAGGLLTIVCWLWWLLTGRMKVNIKRKK